MGFPRSSLAKETFCNAGDPGSIPGSGSFPGEGIDYPLQYSWASLVAQMVKNPPAVWDTWVQSLGLEDPLEEGMAMHSSILAWRIPWTEEPGRLQFMGSQRVRHNWVAKHSTAQHRYSYYSFFCLFTDNYSFLWLSKHKSFDQQHTDKKRRSCVHVTGFVTTRLHCYNLIDQYYYFLNHHYYFRPGLFIYYWLYCMILNFLSSLQDLFVLNRK